MKFPAWFGIVVGLLMLAQWAVSLLFEGAAEPGTESRSMNFAAVIAPFVGASLIAGGTALLKGKTWGVKWLPVGLGLAIYSEITNPGYFAQQGQSAAAVTYGILFLSAIVGGYLLRVARQI